MGLDGYHQGPVERTTYHEVQNLLALRRTRKPGRAKPPMPWPLRVWFAVASVADFEADTGRFEIEFCPRTKQP